MKRKMLMGGATLVAALAIGGGALALQTGPADGQTRAQMLAKAGERFDRLDSDRNGVLTRAERRAGREERRGARQERRRGGPRAMIGRRLDGDGDGRISRAEASAPALRRFDRVDTNRDDYLDTTELAAARERGQQRRERRGAATGRPAPDGA